MVIADIEADLIEYSDYQEVGSVVRARSYITAAERWLILRPDSASNEGSSLSINKSLILDRLKRAQDYVAANASSSGGGRGGVRFLGVGSNFR